MTADHLLSYLFGVDLGLLSDIAAQVEAAGVKRTAVVIVGSVLAAEEFPDSHLYSTTRCR